MKKYVVFLFILLTGIPYCFGQYSFSGEVDGTNWNNTLFLSLVEDYRKVNGVHPEQIINTAIPDSLGRFVFSGDNLSTSNNIYRIHVDNCPPETQNAAHFTGHCTNSKEIVFIANNSDSLVLPFTFDQEMFCKISSSNERSGTILKMDSLIDEMRFDFSSFRSEASRNLNSKKWFTKFQTFGVSINEPLAELYAYQFLSDRTSDLYPYYLQDLENNNYYDQLLSRLEQQHPDSRYTIQYRNELEADKFFINQTTNTGLPNWVFALIGVLLLSILGNFYFFNILQKKKKSKNNNIQNLTQQEQNILDLILQQKTNKEIATQMFISLSTVKTHINNIYKKLDVSSRAEVIQLYQRD